jgi:tetratricopeptide (TPR) repeat protein
MLGTKYLLLELEKFEADFYHLPVFVPYLKKDQDGLKTQGFDWELAVEAMRTLSSEKDYEEYKPYKLFVKKWEHYKLLSQSLKNEEWQEAEKIVNKILSIDLLDPSAYLNLGFVSRSQREFEKAEQAYTKGLELMPDAIPFLAGLARTYEELGKIDDAIYTWKRIVDLTKDTNSSEHEEAFDMLVKHRVYQKIQYRDQKTLRKTSKYVPDENFERLMRRTFQKNYHNIEALTELGLKLIQESYTKLAIKVFERVYQMSRIEGKEIPEHLKI